MSASAKKSSRPDGEGQADFLLCFHAMNIPSEPFFEEGGVTWRPIWPGWQEMIEDPRYLNTALVGVLAAHLPIRRKLAKGLQTVFKPKILEETGRSLPRPKPVCVIHEFCGSILPRRLEGIKKTGGSYDLERDD